MVSQIPLLALAAQLLLLAQTIHAAGLAYKGVDWSSVIVSEKSGRSYKDSSGKVQPLETILKASGVNTVRARLWVNPTGGNYNLDYNLQLAKRAKAAGLATYIDLHYSDTWADPAHQTTPAAWSRAASNVEDLAKIVRNYTRDAVAAFAKNDLPLSLISIGNEITTGLLWPTGRQSGKNTGFNNIARLLGAAAAGVRDANMEPRPKIMVHLDNGWNWETQKWWYDELAKAAAGNPESLAAKDYDVQGISYYPFYNQAATLSALQTSMVNMRKAYGKEVMVVETDWPISCPQPKYAFPSDAKSIPFSAEGQTTWMKEVAKRIVAAGGTGIFYWEPAWIDNAGLGSSCPNNLMVDDSGKARSSLAVFADI